MRLFLLAFLLSLFTTVLAAPTPYMLAREAASASAEVDWVLPNKAVDRRPLVYTPPPIVLSGEADASAKTAQKGKGKGKLTRKNNKVLNDRIARSESLRIRSSPLPPF